MPIFKPTNPDVSPAGRKLRPGGMADRINVAASQRPPPPKGRGVALVLIGLALCYALFHTFVRGGGAGEKIRKEVNERESVPRVANDGPVAVETPPIAEEQIPTWQIPEGLPKDTATALTSAARALERPDRGAALQALHRASLIVQGAPEASRPAVRAFLADRLAEAVMLGTFRREAIDAAVEIQPAAADAAALVVAVSARGLGDDAAAPSALLFLESFEDRGGPDAVRSIEALVLDPKRPLTLRVLAAKTLPHTERSPDLKRLIEDPATPPALRNALRP